MKALTIIVTVAVLACMSACTNQRKVPTADTDRVETADQALEDKRDPAARAVEQASPPAKQNCTAARQSAGSEAETAGEADTRAECEQSEEAAEADTSP
jgi:hypothetical protein